MNMSLQYLDQLDNERQEVFKKLNYFSKHFVLAGGTAIMLQIGHRMSYDFDCFAEKSLPKNLLREAKKTFGRFISPRFQTSELLTFVTDKGVEVTFVNHPYKPLRKKVKTDSISLFHLDDLAANKAYTIGRRGQWRDYVDIFFFLKWELYDLNNIIGFAKKKFEGEFNEKLFLEQLVYFDDLLVAETVYLKESYEENEIKSFLEKQVEEYFKEKLPVR